jgi:hypothetical protein
MMLNQKIYANPKQRCGLQVKTEGDSSYYTECVSLFGGCGHCVYWVSEWVYFEALSSVSSVCACVCTCGYDGGCVLLRPCDAQTQNKYTLFRVNHADKRFWLRAV